MGEISLLRYNIFFLESFLKLRMWNSSLYHAFASNKEAHAKPAVADNYRLHATDRSPLVLFKSN